MKLSEAEKYFIQNCGSCQRCRTDRANKKIKGRASVWGAWERAKWWHPQSIMDKMYKLWSYEVWFLRQEIACEGKHLSLAALLRTFVLICYLNGLANIYFKVLPIFCLMLSENHVVVGHVGLFDTVVPKTFTALHLTVLILDEVHHLLLAFTFPPWCLAFLHFIVWLIPFRQLWVKSFLPHSALYFLKYRHCSNWLWGSKFCRLKRTQNKSFVLESL